MSKIQEISPQRRRSLNALRHGLTGQVVVMPGEDLEAYDRHCRAAFADLKPVGFSETEQVQAIVESSWRLKRARTFQTNMLALSYHDTEPLVDTNEPQAAAALVSAAAFQSIAKDLALVSLYEQRINRQYIKAQADLKALQTARRAEEQKALEEAALLKSYHDEEEAHFSKQERRERVPFDPALYNFVFSNAEITSFQRRHNALTDARYRFEHSGKTYFAAAA